MKCKKLLEKCIAEVIIEKAQQKPNKLKSLVKESVVELLKKSLTDGFDPQSDAGPNATINDPGFYANINAKMQKMEEEQSKKNPSELNGKN